MKLKTNLKEFIAKALVLLKVRSRVGGLEVSDSGLRYAVWDGVVWQMTGVALSPGVVVGGTIKNREDFLAALRALHEKILCKKARGKERVSVIVSLSSISIYTQVFSLPFIEGENLDKAIQLNIQMVSPGDFSETYSGWQLVNRDQDKVRLEILSAFLNRAVVDEIHKSILNAGFLPAAIESRALSLSRLIKNAGAGFDPQKSYIVLCVDASGIDLLIVRHGQLYFDYFNSWTEIQGEEKNISLALFETALTRNLRQVLNFYSSHWSDQLASVLFFAPAFAKEIRELVTNQFSLSAEELQISLSQPIGNEWFVALGGGFRGLVSRRSDREISLLGLNAQETFRREELLNFLGFWRLLIPAALGILLLTFGITSIFLGQVSQSLESNSAFNLTADQAQEISTLQKEASAFNDSVASVALAKSSIVTKSPILDGLAGIADTNGVTLNRVYFQGFGTQIALSGFAPTEDRILNFKKSLDASNMFKGVVLPLTNIQPDPRGYNFSITLNAVSPAASK